MESLIAILFIPVFLLLCFVVVWFLRFWIGAFVPDDETMSTPKKTIYNIWNFVFYPISTCNIYKHCDIVL